VTPEEKYIGELQKALAHCIKAFEELGCADEAADTRLAVSFHKKEYKNALSNNKSQLMGDDARHINVSVENTGLCPVGLDALV